MKKARSGASGVEDRDLLRAIIEASTTGILLVEQSGRILMANQQLERLVGYSRAELLGRNLDDLLPERSRALHRDHVKGFHADPHPRQLGAGRDLLALHKDGREVPVEIGLAPVTFDGKSYVLASVVDISQRRSDEEWLRWLSLAVDQSPTSVVMTDLEGNIEYVNAKFTEVTGYSLAEVRGKNPRLLKSGATPPETYRELWAAIKAGRTWHGEITNRKKNGTTYRDSMWVYPIRDTRGNVFRFLALKEDITERAKLEAQYRQAQKMEAVGRLAGGVAHDFNNLLTAIFGYADLLNEALPADHPGRPDVDEIRTAATRASALTRQLLAFSRQQVLRPAVINLNDIVQGMEKMLRRLIGEDIDLRTVLAPHLGNVRADPSTLEQVMMNLAVNARDAMPTGGKLTIETANVELDAGYAMTHAPVVPGRYVMLAISDTGVGMDEATKARVFEPFFTTKEPGKGTGLGLATVYGIVKQSSGYVWLYSEPGHGATFKVYLPRIEAPVEAGASTEPAAPSLAGTETILLAEDDELLRPLARALLAKLGYRVLEARTGPEALQVARGHEGDIHLLVSDVVMPGQGGFQLAQQLQAERPKLRVLYMSGYSDEAVVRHGLLQPGMNYLQKPFTPAVLARKVREVLDAK